eukprot:scaffold94_cov254-Pinguiococcus_pyrenoidosus.AAC.18
MIPVMLLGAFGSSADSSDGTSTSWLSSPSSTPRACKLVRRLGGRPFLADTPTFVPADEGSFGRSGSILLAPSKFTVSGSCAAAFPLPTWSPSGPWREATDDADGADVLRGRIMLWMPPRSTPRSSVKRWNSAASSGVSCSWVSAASSWTWTSMSSSLMPQSLNAWVISACSSRVS